MSWRHTLATEASGVLELVNTGAHLVYRWGLARVERAAVPVVSVGNIACGGTGKTPLVAAIAGRLAELGARPAILTRGYRRRDPRPRLVRGTPAPPWQEIGDEPALLARLLPGVAIVVDADRVRGAAAAVGEAGATHLVLDDGFQHWRLARDLDVVTHAADDPLCERRPRRERPRALARADLALAVGADRDALAEARPLVCAHAPGLPLVGCALRATAVTLAGERHGPDWLRGRRVLPFAAIAAPWRFFDTIAGLGGTFDESFSFPDHHACTAAELAAVLRRAGELGALPVTTAKDAVKLADDQLERVAWLAVELEPLPGALLALLEPLLRATR